MIKELPMNVPFEEGPLLQLIQKLEAFRSSLNEQQQKDFEELMELLAETGIDEYIDDDMEDVWDHEEDEGFSRMFIPTKFVYLLTVKVKLLRVKPLIWRKLEVPSNITMGAFSELVNIAMGWDGGHLHDFHVGRHTIDEDNEFNVILGDFLVKKGDKIKYEYDFGDGWVHEIELIADPIKDDAQTVKLLSGKNACPPEDFGGPWRYNAFLQALHDGDTDRLNDEFDGIMDWLPDDFDPEYFDVEEFQEAVDEFVSSCFRVDLPF